MPVFSKTRSLFARSPLAGIFLNPLVLAVSFALLLYYLLSVDIDELRETLERYKEKTAPKTNEKFAIFALAPKLTEREVQIIELLLQNKTSKEIGDILELSRHTVDTHRRRILGKVGVGSSMELLSSL